MKNGWKKLGNMLTGAVIVNVGISGYGLARIGETRDAWTLTLLLLLLWSAIKDAQHTKKLENTILEQESILLRTEYIRNKMLEEKAWK